MLTPITRSTAGIFVVAVAAAIVVSCSDQPSAPRDANQRALQPHGTASSSASPNAPLLSCSQAGCYAAPGAVMIRQDLGDPTTGTVIAVNLGPSLVSARLNTINELNFTVLGPPTTDVARVFIHIYEPTTFRSSYLSVPLETCIDGSGNVDLIKSTSCKFVVAISDNLPVGSSYPNFAAFVNAFPDQRVDLVSLQVAAAPTNPATLGFVNISLSQKLY